MSTYEELIVILTVGLLIVAILNLKVKHIICNKYRFFNYNLKMPRYANTGAFRIDSKRIMAD